MGERREEESQGRDHVERMVGGRGRAPVEEFCWGGENEKEAKVSTKYRWVSILQIWEGEKNRECGGRREGSIQKGDRINVNVM